MDKLFFWLLTKKIKFLFDFTHNDYAIINLIFLGVSFFQAFVFGQLLSDTDSLIFYISSGFYGFMIHSKKNFRVRFIPKYYPIPKFSQYALNFFLNFFDFSFLLLFTFGIGLYGSSEHFTIRDFLFFLFCLLNTYTLLNILLGFQNEHKKVFFIKLIAFLSTSFLGIAVRQEPNQNLYGFLLFSVNYGIGYFLFWTTYDSIPQQQHNEKRTLFNPFTRFAYLNALHRCIIPLKKTFASFLQKLVLFLVFIQLLEGVLEYDTLEFMLFAPFLFTPYTHLSYFNNIWGINSSAWFLLNASHNPPQKLLTFFLHHLSLFVFVDLLFIGMVCFYFSIPIRESNVFGMYFINLMVFIPISFSCSILYPFKVSAASFYERDAMNPALLLLFAVCYSFSFSFFANVYFTVMSYIIYILLAFILFKRVYSNYSTHKYNLYNLLFN